jgi:signal transduction histidine kinase/DNA-binding response OmpR family regulator
MPNNVYWLDRNCITQGCNDNVLKFVGLEDLDDFIGISYEKMSEIAGWKQGHAEIYKRDDMEVMSSGIPKLNIEDPPLYDENGESIYFLSSRVPLFNDKTGEVIGIVGISVDITQLKKMIGLRAAKLKAEAGNRAKSDFIANMSHDIRTPLTGILGLIQELIDTADHISVSLKATENSQDQQVKKTDLWVTSQLNQLIEKIQEDGQLIIGATDELLQLLNEILETMRLESGKVSETVESFDLYELINHNIELMQPVAQKKKLELINEIDKDLPVYFNGYRNYLDRTLLNLMSNALKFTEKGFVRVKVALKSEDKNTYQTDDKIELIISVEDTGIGIPEDKFSSIFEHFSRLTPSYQGLYKGAGLGLYTVKRYIEAMQAKIFVKSEIGKGSCFIIHIPLIVSDHSDREKISHRREVPINKERSTKKVQLNQLSNKQDQVRILIVEDNIIAARSIQANINNIGDCVSNVAENGKTAIAMSREDNYDLILMDIGLPDMDGIEVTKKISATDHSSSKAPIIGLTGHGDDPKIREEAIKVGFQDIFTKPMSSSQLQKVINQYVYQNAEQKPMEKVSIIDWEANLQNMNGDQEYLHEILSIFAEELMITKKKLDQYYSSSDIQALCKELHKSRGGIAYLVLPELSDALAKLHKEAKKEPMNSKLFTSAYKKTQRAIDNFNEYWQRK